MMMKQGVAVCALIGAVSAASSAPQIAKNSPVSPSTWVHMSNSEFKKIMKDDPWFGQYIKTWVEQPNFQDVVTIRADGTFNEDGDEYNSTTCHYIDDTSDPGEYTAVKGTPSAGGHYLELGKFYQLKDGTYIWITIGFNYMEVFVLQDKNTTVAFKCGVEKLK